MQLAGGGGSKARFGHGVLTAIGVVIVLTYILHEKSKENPNRYKPRRNLNHTGTVTLVTAFFDIGDYKKGNKGDVYFGPDLYRKWMLNYWNIKNPVVAYFDNHTHAEHFQTMRVKFPRKTKIILIKRNSLWAFKIRNQIAKIYANKTYYKHHPNTVVPEYSCAMHAKYELLARTAKWNPYKTDYLAWTDIGLWRHLDLIYTPRFKIQAPRHLGPRDIAFGMYKPREHLDTHVIIGENLVWICGGYSVGSLTAMIMLAADYKNHTEYMIQQNIMSTDQQVRNERKCFHSISFHSNLNCHHRYCSIHFKLVYCSSYSICHKYFNLT